MSAPKNELSAAEAAAVARRLHVDFWKERFGLDDFRVGMGVELEQRPEPPLTREQCAGVGRTVLGHLHHASDYYRKWETRQTPSLGPWGERADW